MKKVLKKTVLAEDIILFYYNINADRIRWGRGGETNVRVTWAKHEKIIIKVRQYTFMSFAARRVFFFFVYPLA